MIFNGLTVKECSDPGHVANAGRRLTGTIPGNKVYYTCNTGYKHYSGNLIRTCKLLGYWNGKAPICKSKFI